MPRALRDRGPTRCRRSAPHWRMCPTCGCSASGASKAKSCNLGLQMLKRAFLLEDVERRHGRLPRQAGCRRRCAHDRRFAPKRSRRETPAISFQSPTWRPWAYIRQSNPWRGTSGRASRPHARRRTSGRSARSRRPLHRRSRARRTFASTRGRRDITGWMHNDPRRRLHERLNYQSSQPLMVLGQ